MTQGVNTVGKPTPPAVLILEKTPFWSAELNRQFLDEPVSIRVRNQVQDVFSLLASNTVKILIIGVEIELDSVLRLLTDLSQSFPEVQTLVLLSTENLELEWSLREVGVSEIIPAPVSGDQLKQILRRRLKDHLSRTNSLTKSH